ncbi:Conserved protein containing a thioredoxin domain [Dehalogenimonas alkenigignens]|uniref:Conserved protein containing a thioredoxin domain n=1 Tax=Dehalogenimonas alkenigignens TaxID=1217799 RepID=A0A0W0GHK3_9CHLR|nr:thioredoxin domain-containing protein [Dehalogenimonas alkenigignens]KTB48032.1 Conserved protein containing a thioredoxin domain [Dehalogenimonas alkenigignens]
MPNRLASSFSPYLRQHAENPVDWYPWGDEALNRARSENKPILLSIGYSACHWCHVMAHESFENPETARLMNQHFVNIKVDREERPDLDSVYMAAVQTMTGHGGWPMTVFLTPDGRPFYGGTYFPPEDRHGLPAFPRVLEAVADTFRSQPARIAQTAGRLESALKRSEPCGSGLIALAPDILHRAYQALAQDFDVNHGGFGDAPKFPQPLALEFLLRYFHNTRSPGALGMVERTLAEMYRGGVYDHLGGGFHRYATDAAWQVPHFEKMLYDNALLSRVYLHAFQVTGNTAYRSVAEEVFAYVLREMTDPATGGFFSSQDADSDGEEGKYYTWTADEIDEVLGPAGETFRERFGVTRGGNFEGRNILHLTDEFSEAAIAQDREAREALWRRRQWRNAPGKDTKIIASWNGMMAGSLAEAACVLGRPDYLSAAARAMEYVLNEMGNGDLLRHTISAEIGFLEDYAQIIDASLWLHQASLSPRWLRSALKLSERMVAEFWDESDGGFYDAPTDTKGLFIRPRNLQDGAVPSGGSTAAIALLKLARITDDQRYHQIGSQALKTIGDIMGRHPLGFTNWLAGLDMYLGSAEEITIIGGKDDPAAMALARAACQRFRPNRLVVGLDPEEPGTISNLPIFTDRPQRNGMATAYVCRDFSCRPPVTSPEDLEQLSAAE